MVNHEQLKSILRINKTINTEINALVEKDKYILKKDGINLADSISLMFRDKHELMQVPIKDDKTGGIILKRNENYYCYVNTTQIRAFQNFVYLHELYHLLHGMKGNVLIIPEQIEDTTILNERKANYYASLMLLEKDALRKYFFYFKNDLKQDLTLTIYRLMDLFKVTFKTVLIRLYEIQCIEDYELFYTLFIKYNLNNVYNAFKEHGMDTGLLEPSNSLLIGNIKKEIEYAKKHNTIFDDIIEMNEVEYNKILDRIKSLQKF